MSLCGNAAQGGDQRSHRIEAHAELILQTYQARPQIFLRELRQILSEQGIVLARRSTDRGWELPGCVEHLHRRTS